MNLASVSPSSGGVWVFRSNKCLFSCHQKPRNPGKCSKWPDVCISQLHEQCVRITPLNPGVCYIMSVVLHVNDVAGTKDFVFGSVYTCVGLRRRCRRLLLVSQWSVNVSDTNTDARVLSCRSTVRAWPDCWPLLMELWRVDPTMTVSRAGHRHGYGSPSPIVSPNNKHSNVNIITS